MEALFQSILDTDRAPIVVCDCTHTVVYMNPAAISRYRKDLVGKSLMDCHGEEGKKRILQVVDWFLESPKHNMIFTYYNPKENKDVYMVALRKDETLIGYYEKHEYRNRETAALYDFSKSLG